METPLEKAKIPLLSLFFFLGGGVLIRLFGDFFFFFSGRVSLTFPHSSGRSQSSGNRFGNDWETSKLAPGVPVFQGKKTGNAPRSTPGSFGNVPLPKNPSGIPTLPRAKTRGKKKKKGVSPAPLLPPQNILGILGSHSQKAGGDELPSEFQGILGKAVVLSPVPRFPKFHLPFPWESRECFKARKTFPIKRRRDAEGGIKQTGNLQIKKADKRREKPRRIPRNPQIPLSPSRCFLRSRGTFFIPKIRQLGRFFLVFLPFFYFLWCLLFSQRRRT